MQTPARAQAAPRISMATSRRDKAQAPAAAAQPPSSLLRAAQRLLAPLVRLLLAHGVTHAQLAELLKRVYLQVAEEELARGSGRVTASRLSVSTGLHRKDIRRLRGPAPHFDPPSSVSLGARLIARWTAEPPYRDARGRPRALPRVGGDAESASFESLVASISTDVRPRAVLDEWLRLGLVEIDAEDRVALRTEAFVPRAGFDEKAHFLGRNVADHLATAAHNLGEGEPRLERSAHYRGLSAASADELHELATRLGMEALQELDRRARALQQRDAGGPAEARERTNFGVYFHRESEVPDREDGEERNDDDAG